MASPSHVVVVGQMGVGKSTLATALAAHLGRAHLDSDTAIADRLGRSGRDVAATDGVDVLHELELEVLLGHLGDEPAAVVSAAASVIDSEIGRAALSTHTVLWLDLPVDELRVRLRSGAHRRSITRDQLAALDARRRPMLERLADVRLDASDSPDRVRTRALAFIRSG